MNALAQAPLWQPNYAIVDASEKLQAIHKKHINLAVWQRATDAGMLPVLHWLAREPFELEYKTEVCDISPSLHKHLQAPLEFEQSRHRLIADIAHLARIFEQHAGSSRIRLVVESVHNVPCPKFHQDSIPLRLICTYSGAGTQWLENSNVNTHAQCCGGKVVRDDSRIQQLMAFDVALMKGKLWPKNDMGIYHCSPQAQDNQPRLVVKMDVA